MKTSCRNPYKLGSNLLQCQIVHQEIHTKSPGIEPGYPKRESTDVNAPGPESITYNKSLSNLPI